MVVIVGLGNPGSEYDGTRHNVGFAVVGELAARLRIGLRGSGNHRGGSGQRMGTQIVLAQPLTYMNNSGEAVRSLLAEHGVPPGGLIVCCDDLHLPLGSVRLRKKGSDGGHNGLRSIIREIGTDEFPRLRCGIRGGSAPAPGDATADYVLSAFEGAELPRVREMVSGAADTVLAVVRDGIDRAMNVVNAKQSNTQ
jgi:peptidyl-tRNA hydrolase, PTH1 family